jgi:hypothetical protein
VVFLPITLLILLLDHLYPAHDMVQYLKYTTIITLFIAVTSMEKQFWEQKIMAASFLFVVIADFFSVFLPTFDYLTIDTSLLGSIGFLIAYLLLIVAYQKKFKLDRAETISGILVIVVFLYVFITLLPFIHGVTLLGALVFGVVLCYMTWSAICTVFRHHYNFKTACLIAISGLLMFISDIGVAFSVFHPCYAGIHVAWLKNIVWAGYIPGWTVLAVVISEKNIHMY